LDRSARVVAVAGSGVMRIAGPAVPFVDEVPAYEIRDGNMHILVGGECLCCMSLRTFEKGSARAQRVIAEYHVRGAVVEMPRRRRGKAPDHAA
jgi:hypothetical protein